MLCCPRDLSGVWAVSRALIHTCRRCCGGALTSKTTSGLPGGIVSPIAQTSSFLGSRGPRAILAGAAHKLGLRGHLRLPRLMQASPNT